MLNKVGQIPQFEILDPFSEESLVKLDSCDYMLVTNQPVRSRLKANALENI